MRRERTAVRRKRIAVRRKRTVVRRKIRRTRKMSTIMMYKGQILWSLMIRRYILQTLVCSTRT